MAAQPIERVVILGGGTAGWLSATMLSKLLGRIVEITVVESDEIGIVGVGEATIPPLISMLRGLGIDENDLIRHTQGTFKLGIEFKDWSHTGATYSHAFGVPGHPLAGLPFYQYWLKQHLAGGQAGSLWDYSFNDLAAKQNRFARLPLIPDTPMDGLAHALHFDAGLMAKYLRQRCEASGVIRREGKVAGVNLRAADGFIDSLTLASGEVITGDFFIDCSGFQGLLIEGALKAGYEDWTPWLPCDRALAVPSRSTEPLRPYTQAKAHAAGWQWRIPLQHRVGNGHVFASAFMEPDEVGRILLDHLESEALAEPRLLKFTAGRRKSSWVKNCVAVGLASGFMEPLESTSIHLAQSAIQRLLRLFPDKGFNQVEIDEYNRQTRREYELIRDFIVLHYKATERDDSPFWRHIRATPMPDSLAHKIAFFRQHGRVLVEEDDLFKEGSWVQVLIGQGIIPESCSPLTRAVPETDITGYMANIRAIYDRTLLAMPGHADFIAHHCQAFAF